MAIELWHILTLISGVGIAALYLRVKRHQREIREARELLFEVNNRRVREIDEQVKKLEEEFVVKRGEHEKKVLEFRNKFGTGNDDSGDSSK
jgi:hypothetical protein